MSKTPNKAMIGFFTLAGLALFIGAMAIFLGDKLFVNKKDLVVLYFDESIKGLNVGSPVVLQGVEVGKVMKIDLITDTETLSFKIPVYVKMNNEQVIADNKHIIGTENRGRFIDRLVGKGLRGRLVTQNLLTGQLMIELAFIPDSPATYKGNGKNIEVPTALSPLGEISKGIQDLPIRQSIENFNKLIGETAVMVGDLHEVITSNRVNAASTVDNLNKTIRDIGEAALALRNFADYIERHPEALIKGKGRY